MGFVTKLRRQQLAARRIVARQLPNQIQLRRVVKRKAIGWRFGTVLRSGRDGRILLAPFVGGQERVAIDSALGADAAQS